MSAGMLSWAAEGRTLGTGPLEAKVSLASPPGNGLRGLLSAWTLPDN